MIHQSKKHVALVHDYIKEFGGAERVLKTLHEMYPDAPIYTAFRVKGSAADKELKDADIRECFLAPILKIGKLYSPLRFLTPLIWRSMDLSHYDVVITSASWYITRGFRVGKNTKVICYCHTPPRWLYGYETSIELQKYWPVRMYALLVGHFIRMYDAWTVKTVDIWIANSENVKKRIQKHYRVDAKVIYPPIEVEMISKFTSRLPEPIRSETHGRRLVSESKRNTIPDQVRNDNKSYFLIVSRLVGAKGLEEAAHAFKSMKHYKLMIVGEKAGFSDVEKRLQELAGGNVNLLGRVSDKEIYTLYANAKGFIALARDEDFGMTPVEAMAAGTPVIAFNGGGFKESVLDGKTGILINDTDTKTIEKAIKRFNQMKWNKSAIQKHAMKFSREKFEKEIRKLGR